MTNGEPQKSPDQGGDTSCFDFISPTVVIDDIEATTATFRAELLSLPPIEVIDHGFCWSTEPTPAADATNCESLGAVESEGSFDFPAQDLSPGTEYYVQAFAETADGMQSSDEADFRTKPGAPQNVSASSGDHESHVLVQWEATEGAVSYRVYRDGTLVEEVTVDGSSTYSLEDDGAAPGAVPEEPTDLTVTQMTDRVRIEWSPAFTAQGPGYDYSVVAVNESGESESSGSDEGYRGPRPVQTYELRSSPDEQSWTSWDEVTNPGALRHDDFIAPSGSITDSGLGGTTASDATNVDYVELVTSEASLEDGAEVFYEIRAVNESGEGDAGSTSGRRTTGDEITYDWEYFDDGDQQWKSVSGCSDTRLCNDGSAPADGSWREYRAVLSAVGVSDEIADAGEGRRAVQGTVTTVAVDSTQIGSTQATVAADIVALGIPTPDNHGFCFDQENSDPTHHSGAECTAGGALSNGAFDETLNLEPGSSYYVQAFIHTDADGAGYAYGGVQELTTRTEAPSGVQTDSDVDHVTISWAPVAGAAHYEVLRDGTETVAVVDANDLLAVEDEGADPGTGTATPALTVTDGFDAVALSWQEVGVNDGTTHAYTVVAINDDGLESEPSSPVPGNRLGEVLGYQVQFGGGSWTDIASALHCTISAGSFVCEDEATEGSIDADGEISVSQAQYVGHVALQSDAATTSHGPVQDYRVRAIDGAGQEGDPSNTESGRRLAGAPQYQWARTDAVGVFQNLEVSCANDLVCTDDTAPAGGETRAYKLRISADGITGLVSFPDTGGVAGWRAVDGAVDTLELDGDDVAPNEATFTGQVIAAGDPGPIRTEHQGFCYSSQTSTPDHDDDCIDVEVTELTNQVGESFQATTDGLEPATIYWVRAFVKTDAEDAVFQYGSTRQFETLSPPPTDVVAVRGDEEARIRWSTPAGSSAVEDYEVTVYDAQGEHPPSGVTGEQSRMVGSDSTEFIFDGLSNDVEYTFRVRAENTQGLSPHSELSNVVMPRPPFRSVWDTTNPGSTDDDQITLPLTSSGDYDFFVAWGDGTVDHITQYDQGEVTHT